MKQHIQGLAHSNGVLELGIALWTSGAWCPHSFQMTPLTLSHNEQHKQTLRINPVSWKCIQDVDWNNNFLLNLPHS